MREGDILLGGEEESEISLATKVCPIILNLLSSSPNCEVFIRGVTHGQGEGISRSLYPVQVYENNLLLYHRQTNRWTNKVVLE